MRIESLSHRFPDAAWPLFQEVGFDLCQGTRGPGRSQWIGQEHLVVSDPREGEDIARASLVVQNCDLMLFSSSVYEEVALAPRNWVFRRRSGGSAFHAARELGLEELIEDPPQALSQGQRLRTAVAAALTLAPSLLLLDEPTTGQDQHQLTRVMTGASKRIGFPSRSCSRRTTCVPWHGMPIEYWCWPMAD